MDKVQNITRFLVEELQAPPEVLTGDYPLVANKVIDSLGIFKVVAFIEEEYGIAVEDEDLVLDNFASITSIVGLVESKLIATLM